MILFREFAQRYREPVIRADVLWSAVAFVAQVAIGGIVAIGAYLTIHGPLSRRAAEIAPS